MNFKAIFALFTMGAKKVLAERAVLGGQIVVYWVIVSIYALFFSGVMPERLARFHLTVPQLIWYFAFTQIIVGCTFFHWRDLEQDIRMGRLEAMLLRPVDFWPLMLAEWFGQYAMRIMLIGPFGLLAAWTISGVLPVHGAAPYILVLPCLWLGGLLFLCLHMLVGCCALWSNPVEPVYRIWQKMTFFIGARTSPLLLYPLWAQGLIWLTPFPAILAVPGSLALGMPGLRLACQILLQLFWLAVALGSVWFMARAVRRHVMRHG